MDVKLTMAYFPGNPSMFIVGEKIKIHGEEYLNDAYLLLINPQGAALAFPPGATKGCQIPMGKELFSYPVTDKKLVDAYLKEVTGIEVVRAPLATMGNVVPMGVGPRPK